MPFGAKQVEEFTLQAQCRNCSANTEPWSHEYYLQGVQSRCACQARVSALMASKRHRTVNRSHPHQWPSHSPPDPRSPGPQPSPSPCPQVIARACANPGPEERRPEVCLQGPPRPHWPPDLRPLRGDRGRELYLCAIPQCPLSIQGSPGPAPLHSPLLSISASAELCSTCLCVFVVLLSKPTTPNPTPPAPHLGLLLPGWE